MRPMTQEALPDESEWDGTHLNSCDDCLLGKQYGVSFVRNNTSKTMKVLERVYSNV